MFSRRTISLALVPAFAAAAAANYILTPVSKGMSSRVVAWGESFPLEVVLASDAGDLHNSAIFQLIFTEPGLIYEAYDWSAPYTNLPPYDDSKPRLDMLPQPIDIDTFFNPASPDLIDVELSNVLIGDEFGEGTLVTLQLRVPENFGFLGTMYIAAAPDTFARGFDEIPTSAGPLFELTVVPQPSSLAALAWGLAFVLQRHNRRIRITRLTRPGRWR